MWRCLFTSDKFCSYLKLYSAKKASDLQNPHKATVTVVDHIPCEPARKVAKQSIPLSKEQLQLVLSPTAVHPGLSQILGDNIYEFEISHETIRTQLFKLGLTHMLKGTNYTIGTSVDLPYDIRDSYSMYGTSRNDICITHKQFFDLERLSGAIVHMCPIPDDDDSQDFLDNTFLNAAVMEFK